MSKQPLGDEVVRRLIARASWHPLEVLFWATALASIYSGHPARRDTAMTGEITLSGLVLPIGGVKEKVLAARRAGLRRIILPKENQKDLREIPDEVRAEMEFVPVERVKDVLTAAIPELAATSVVLPAA